MEIRELETFIKRTNVHDDPFLQYRQDIYEFPNGWRVSLLYPSFVTNYMFEVGVLWDGEVQEDNPFIEGSAVQRFNRYSDVLEFLKEVKEWKK